jgi:hypothetical protein
MVLQVNADVVQAVSLASKRRRFTVDGYKYGSDLRDRIVGRSAASDQARCATRGTIGLAATSV